MVTVEIIDVIIVHSYGEILVDHIFASMERDIEDSKKGGMKTLDTTLARRNNLNMKQTKKPTNKRGRLAAISHNSFP